MIKQQRLSRRDFLKGGGFTSLTTLGMVLFHQWYVEADAIEPLGEPEWQITLAGKLILQGCFTPGSRKDLHVPVQNGIAHIVLDGNRIFVHKDNEICPKKICSLMGSISCSGESIICLPNRLVIRVF